MPFTQLKNDKLAANYTTLNKGIFTANGLVNNEKIMISIYTDTVAFSGGDEDTDSKWSPLTVDNSPLYLSNSIASIRLPVSAQYRFTSVVTENNVKLGVTPE